MSIKQNGKAVKTAFAPLFTIITLTVIVLVVALVSVVSIMNLRSTSHAQIEAIMRERASRLTVALGEKFDLWASLVSHSAIGATSYIQNENGVDKAAIQNLFSRIVDAQREPDVWLLYCTNNQVWNEEGGFAIYHDGGVPEADWNNTERVWFKAAKANPGKVAYSEPYYAARNGQLTISLSTNIYDTAGNDLGVASGDVSIDFLESMLNADSLAPEQTTYMIDMEGRFITHSDPEAVLEKNYFAESGLERFRDRILGTPAFSELDDDVYIYASAIPEAKWVLVSTIPASIIFADANRLTVNLIILNSLLVIIAALLAVILTRVLNHERTENITMNRLLKDERDEILAMKDSLKTGVFLMNKEYVIQGHYSRALEEVLAASNLEGTRFDTLLAGSLSAREQELIKDYFDMVQSRSLPQKKLDSFNPLGELNYVSVETHKEKNLRCGFTSVEREGQVFVLGVIEDITAEIKLKKRLAEEEAKRQEEMRSLFEVIHVSPSVFSDFVTDAGHNFGQVMKLLKDDTVSSADVLVRIYQLMHAVKSDAYILGLKGFGDKLHALEGKLKALRDTENPDGIPLDDMLQLTVDIEKILQEKDKMVSTLDTVRAYQTDVQQKPEQDEYVLVESLKRACEKVAADLEKKVRFTVRRMDSAALKSAPRREVKEMLTQIVRNAVYHGIESPEARVAKGKNETGVIELSVQKEGDMVRISLQDDGKGLDFAAIRRKAVERNLLSEEDANKAENQGRLLQTIFAPEFSTAESVGAHAGRGIGLNLVQDQVRELGGSVKVQTAPDKGTAFVMLIPAR